MLPFSLECLKSCIVRHRPFSKTTDSALDSASGSVLSSEARSAYAKHAQLVKTTGGPSYLEPKPKQKPRFRKGILGARGATANATVKTSVFTTEPEHNMTSHGS